ncbi:hypothetical protein QBC34DRAFT_437638 [Podospora aff. communis PSN243]|uniref:Transmembrane protein n=1 Tax=Podospora aff. communis PSN243 TaxID=3040156 RepID=A0AAV9GPS5_9PEZI|nr:hypothetical protein QBC34DRAFT_437638 [Podospora aff. communis PSN243]
MPTPRHTLLQTPKDENEKSWPIPPPTPTHTTRYAPLRPSCLNPSPPSTPPTIAVVSTRRKSSRSRCRRNDVGLGQRLLRRKAAAAYRSEIDQNPGERESTSSIKANTNSDEKGSGNGNTWMNRLAWQGGRGNTIPLLELWRHGHGIGGKFATQGNDSGNRFAAAQGNTQGNAQGNKSNTRVNRFAPGADKNLRQQTWKTRLCQDQGAVVPQGGRQEQQEQQQREEPVTEKEGKEAETEEKVENCTTQYDRDNGGNAERIRSPSQADAFHTVDIARVQSQPFMTTEPGAVVAFPIRRKPDIASVRLALVVLALVCSVGLVHCAMRSFGWLSGVPE